MSERIAQALQRFFYKRPIVFWYDELRAECEHSLDRGLDVFQRYEMNDAFDFSNRLQQHRQCNAFEATFIRNRDNAQSA